MSSLLVMSDTHGLTTEVKRLVERVTARKKVSRIIHCGDFCCDRHQEPFSKMVLVRGNCDVDDTVPEERIIDWEGLRILVVHGHLLRVKQTAMNLRYRAMETGSHIVCFGHTHVMTCTESGDILFVNPGSLARPRQTSDPSFAIIEKIVGSSDESSDRESHVRVKVRYFTRQLQLIKNQGGVFTIPKHLV